MGPTKYLWHLKYVMPRGLSYLQQIFDSMSHMAVIKILFATVALENTVSPKQNELQGHQLQVCVLKPE